MLPLLTSTGTFLGATFSFQFSLNISMLQNSSFLCADDTVPLPQHSCTLKFFSLCHQQVCSQFIHMQLDVNKLICPIKCSHQHTFWFSNALNIQSTVVYAYRLILANFVIQRVNDIFEPILSTAISFRRLKWLLEDINIKPVSLN